MGSVRGSTLGLRLEQGANFISIVAEFRREADEIVCEPFLMGFPMLMREDGSSVGGWASFFAYDFFENYVEDIDEFSRVQNTPVPENSEPMRGIAEGAFKQCIAKILGDSATADWGGEASDFFSSHIHLAGRRTTAAFLFKGPAKFAPMGLNHLGKNNDQLVRLCREPAGVFVVQHCHDIKPAVRETFRALAVQPGNARRYCLMDGRDSLRLLRAYGVFEGAKSLTASIKKRKREPRKPRN